MQGSTPILAQIYLTGSWPSVVTLYVDQKSNMAILAFDWLADIQEADNL